MITNTIYSAWDYPDGATDQDALYQGLPDNNDVQVLPSTTRDPALGDLGLGIGKFDESGRHEGVGNLTLDLRQITGDPARTSDGVIVRGSCDLTDLRVLGVKGDKARDIEAFGVRYDNRDPHGDVHGGSSVDRVQAVSHHENAYITGICMGTHAHPGIPLMRSFITDCDVALARGNHAGYTATRRVTLEDNACTGVKYGFYCDTGHLNDVLVRRLTATVHRAAVGLAVDVDQAFKENLIIEGGHFMYDPLNPGDPCFALEAFDKLGIGGIRNIHFRECVFSVPFGVKFLLFSTDAYGVDSITFDGCSFPSGVQYNAPNASTSVLARVRVNDRPINIVAGRYVA